MENDCKSCEAEHIDKYADLMMKYDKLKNYKKLLEQSLDIKEELNKALREENEKLKYKYELLRQSEE